VVTLIAYGTKYGSTEEVAKEIASNLHREEYPVKVVDLDGQRDIDLEQFDLVVVGSCIIYGSWTKGAVRFLERYHRTLGKKKLAMFACCGDLLLDPDREDEYSQKYLVDMADRYGLHPMMIGLFGGVLDFGRYSFLVKGILDGGKVGRTDLKEKGIDPSVLYDLRDWSIIREWASELRGVQ
jgi:menaquinone-dependent protoporphyrinogen oxidase